PDIKAPYYGNTLAMTQVVDVVNRNAQRIPTLHADLSFKVEVTDENGKKDGVSGEGILNYRRSSDYRGMDDLRIKGSKVVIGPIFDLGFNKENYWLSLIPNIETAWYGSSRNLGKPCVQNLPIRP